MKNRIAIFDQYCPPTSSYNLRRNEQRYLGWYSDWIRAGGPGFDFHQGYGFFSTPQPPDQLWSPPSLLSNRYRELFPREAKRTRREADHSTLPSAEVKNGRAIPPLPEGLYDMVLAGTTLPLSLLFVGGLGWSVVNSPTTPPYMMSETIL
jgi:hypothetical protein